MQNALRAGCLLGRLARPHCLAAAQALRAGKWRTKMFQKALATKLRALNTGYGNSCKVCAGTLLATHLLWCLASAGCHVQQTNKPLPVWNGHPVLSWQVKLLNWLIFSGQAAATGGRLRLMCCGGGRLPTEVRSSLGRLGTATSQPREPSGCPSWQGLPRGVRSGCKQSAHHAECSGWACARRPDGLPTVPRLTRVSLAAGGGLSACDPVV